MRRLLLLFLALWLPVANAWALVVPCEHAKREGAKAALERDAGTSAAKPCHQYSERTAPAADDLGSMPDTACDDCVHCHLSAAPALPSAHTVDFAYAHPVQHAHARLGHTLFIPRLPLPPPVA